MNNQNVVTIGGGIAAGGALVGSLACHGGRGKKVFVRQGANCKKMIFIHVPSPASPLHHHGCQCFFNVFSGARRVMRESDALGGSPTSGSQCPSEALFGPRAPSFLRSYIADALYVASQQKKAHGRSNIERLLTVAYPGEEGAKDLLNKRGPRLVTYSPWP